MSDPVKAPAHYSGDGKITCKHAMRSMMYDAEVTPTQAYWWGCVFKYLWRWVWKNGLQDLLKCRESLDNLIMEVKEGGDLERHPAQVGPAGHCREGSGGKG